MELSALLIFGLFHTVLCDLFDGMSQTALIPWQGGTAPSDPFGSPPHVSMVMSCTSSSRCPSGRTIDYTPTVDTGSCGILISAIDIPDFTTALCVSGWQYLSSSDKLYKGCWINRDVIFNPGSTSTTSGEVTATVPVLAVTATAVCDPHYAVPYDVLMAPSLCPDNTTVYTSYPRGITLMGIGFGRQSDGQPQGTPDKNPLLNVTTIGRTQISTLTYWPGYVITTRGLDVGLTNTNAGTTSGRFLYTQLYEHYPYGTSYRHQFDWQELDGCVGFSSTPVSCVTCKIVLDTGFQRGFVRIQKSDGVVLPRNDPDNVSPLNASINVDLVFGNPYIATESFTVVSETTATVPVTSLDKEAPDTPIRAAYSNRLERIVNTGSHVFRIFKMSFDAERGKLGLDAA
ncbi:hypothetical protein GQ53DRAFT_852456 [Thozetella sp. PMI_491]|nr:hypothetical protein GQ53DRAFT_852456 [Thozetella sp. PMI_491]